MNLLKSIFQFFLTIIIDTERRPPHPLFRLSKIDGSGAVWPDHIVDVKRAICWVKDNISQYGGDPECIVIAGGSAGGHLSALAAVTPNNPLFQPGFEDKDTTVQVEFW